MEQSKSRQTGKTEEEKRKRRRRRRRSEGNKGPRQNVTVTGGEREESDEGHGQDKGGNEEPLIPPDFCHNHLIRAAVHEHTDPPVISGSTRQ